MNWSIDLLGKWLDKIRKKGTWINGDVIDSLVPTELPTTRGGSLMGDFDLTCSLDEKCELWDLPY